MTQGFLYPQATLVKDSHENIYHELMSKKAFNQQYGDIDMLCKNIIAYKLKNPKSKVIISSSKLIYAPLLVMYSLIGILTQIGKVKVCITANSELNYLRYLWESINDISNKITFLQWVEDCVSKNAYALNYFKTLQKIERLFNEKDIYYLNVNGLEKTAVINKYLSAFDIKDRSKLNLDFKDYTLTREIDVAEIEAAQDILINKYYKWTATINQKYRS